VTLAHFGLTVAKKLDPVSEKAEKTNDADLNTDNNSLLTTASKTGQASAVEADPPPHDKAPNPWKIRSSGRPAAAEAIVAEAHADVVSSEAPSAPEVSIFETLPPEIFSATATAVASTAEAPASESASAVEEEQEGMAAAPDKVMAEAPSAPEISVETPTPEVFIATATAVASIAEAPAFESATAVEEEQEVMAEAPASDELLSTEAVATVPEVSSSTLAAPPEHIEAALPEQTSPELNNEVVMAEAPASEYFASKKQPLAVTLAHFGLTVASKKTADPVPEKTETSSDDDGGLGNLKSVVAGRQDLKSEVIVAAEASAPKEQVVVPEAKHEGRTRLAPPPAQTAIVHPLPLPEVSTEAAPVSEVRAAVEAPAQVDDEVIMAEAPGFSAPAVIAEDDSDNEDEEDSKEASVAAPAVTAENDSDKEDEEDDSSQHDDANDDDEQMKERCTPGNGETGAGRRSRKIEYPAGTKLRVYWVDDDAWYKGTVTEYTPGCLLWKGNYSV
jgi:hypothetical protein